MPSSYSRSFIKDNLIVIIGHILVYMKGIILMPVIIKTVGVTVYGGFALLSSILGFIFGISSFGVGFKAKRFLPSARTLSERKELFYSQFYFGLLSIIILSFLLVLFNGQLNVYVLKKAVSYSVWIIPLYMISYFLYSQISDYFRYTSRVQYMTIANIAFPYLHIVFILLFFYFFQYINIDVLFYSQSLAACVIIIPLGGLLLKELSIWFSFFSKKELISDIKLGFPLVLNFIVDFVLSGIDRYFIAFYLSVTDVGYYNPGYALGSLIIFLPKAMGTALPQLLCKAVDNKDEVEARRMFNYSIKIFLLLAIPFVVGSFILAKPILILLANEDVAQHAWLVTPIVALATLFYGLNILCSNVLFVKMQTSIIFRLNSFAAIFNVIANMVLLYFFKNIIVAAITTFLGYFLAFVYIKKIVSRYWQIDFEASMILKAIFASFVMAVILFWLNIQLAVINKIVSLSVGFVSGVIVYVLVLMSLKTFSEQEIEFIKNMCRVSS